MFLHIENRKILFALIQKTTYYIEFVQLHPTQNSHWFSNILEQFYSVWIERGRRVPNSARDLLDINKHAMEYMISDLKQLLPPSSHIMSYETPTSLPTYNIALEKKTREDKWTNDFSKYQNEYNSLLASPIVPPNGLPYENPDEKIHNIDELMMQQRKQRDMDLAIFSPNPSIPSANTPQSSSQPRLKIMDTIEQAEIEQSVMAIKDRKAKMVSWSSSQPDEIPTEQAELSATF